MSLLIFQCVHGPHCVYSSICGGTPGLFPPLAIVGNAAVTSCVQISSQVLLSVPLGTDLGVELLGHKVTQCFFFLKNCLFSTVDVPFSTPTSSARGFRSLHILTNTCYFLFVQEMNGSRSWGLGDQWGCPGAQYKVAEKSEGGLEVSRLSSVVGFLSKSTLAQSRLSATLTPSSEDVPLLLQLMAEFREGI